MAVYDVYSNSAENMWKTIPNVPASALNGGSVAQSIPSPSPPSGSPSSAADVEANQSAMPTQTVDYQTDTPAPGLGSTYGDEWHMLNFLAGIDNANKFNAEQAEFDRQYQTAERLAAQDYNSAEALLAWQRAEQSAENARQFELDADSTALQRRMADAMKAGINPMTLVTSGIHAGDVSGNAASSSAASISPQSGSRAAASGNSASIIAAIVSSLGSIAKGLLSFLPIG